MQFKITECANMAANTQIRKAYIFPAISYLTSALIGPNRVI